MFRSFLILLSLVYSNLYAQNTNDAELNSLWNLAEFWEKAGNIEKTIEVTTTQEP